MTLYYDIMKPFLILGLLFLEFFPSCNARTVSFTVEARWDRRAPDGFERDVITLNGQLPGPALVVDQDDIVHFLVKNNLNESTTVHFHGIEMLDTPWSDGVAGLSQKPIPAGGEFLYKWTANEYGTYWYHAHYRSQVDDGMFGPIHIRPKPSQPRPFHRISNNSVDIIAMTAAEANPNLVVVADWLHVTSARLQQIQNETNLENYCTQSILINGRGRVHCLTPQEQKQALAPPLAAAYNGTLEPNGCVPFSPLTEGNTTLYLDKLPSDLIVGCEATTAPNYEFLVDPSMQWASFNFINAGNLLSNVMSIDQHPMWLYAVDGRYVEPQKIDGLTNLNGNRYSVMIRLDNTPGNYTMRASNYGLNQLISGFATVRYKTSFGIGASSTHNITNIMSDRDEHVEGWGHRDNYDHQKHRSRDTSQPYFTYGGFPASSNVTELNDTTIVPFENVPPAREANTTHILYISRLSPPYMYTLEGGIPYPSYPNAYSQNSPLLYYPESNNANNTQLVIKTQNNTWVDLVMVTTDLGGPAHPMHKHSNKFYAIGQGTGMWNWSTVAEAAAAQPQNFNFENPQFRDGYPTLASQGPPTWTVLRYHVVNPGVFLFHCHIQVHLSGGMAVALLDGADVLPQAPAEYGVNGNGIDGNAFAK